MAQNQLSKALVVFLFATTAAYVHSAVACPNLAGKYDCAQPGQAPGSNETDIAQTSSGSVTSYKLTETIAGQPREFQGPADGADHALAAISGLSGTVRFACDGDVLINEFVFKFEGVDGNAAAKSRLSLDPHGNLIEDFVVTMPGSEPQAQKTICTKI